MKQFSNKLLLGSVSIFAITLTFYNFWLDMGLTSKEIPILIYAALFSFLLSILGLIMGVRERKHGNSKAIIGVIGNGLLVLFFSTILFIVKTVS